MKRITFSLMMVAVILTMSACVSSHEYSPINNDDTIVFPRQDELDGERAVMEALVFGTLVLTNGCIYIESNESDTSYLLIWPPGFNLVGENNNVAIHNRDGKGVVNVGDRVRLSGGEVKSLSMLDVYVQEQVPAQCSGPYWIIGDEVTIMEPSK